MLLNKCCIKLHSCHSVFVHAGGSPLAGTWRSWDVKALEHTTLSTDVDATRLITGAHLAGNVRLTLIVLFRMNYAFVECLNYYSSIQSKKNLLTQMWFCIVKLLTERCY